MTDTTIGTFAHTRNWAFQRGYDTQIVFEDGQPRLQMPVRALAEMAIEIAEGVVAGSREYALMWLRNHELEARYCECGRPECAPLGSVVEYNRAHGNTPVGLDGDLEIDPVMSLQQDAAEALARARAGLADPARQFAVTSSGKLHDRRCSFVTLARDGLTAQDVVDRCMVLSALLTAEEASEYLAAGHAACKRCKPLVGELG
jgi:hypothetical protein